MKKVLFAILFILLLGVISFRDIIFQEGNPLPVAIGILKISIAGEQIVKISADPDKYIIKTQDGYKPYIKLMESEGWGFIEQMGSAVIFDRNGQRRASTSRMLTSYYMIITY